MDNDGGFCLICSRECCSSESLIDLIQDTDAGGTCPQLETQQSVLFVLRKLIQLPKDLCQRMISSHGNPSDWGTAFCPQCSGVIEEAQEVSFKITNFVQKFRFLQKAIQDKFLSSFEDDDDVQDTSAKKPLIRQEIRKLCVDQQSTNKEKDDRLVVDLSQQDSGQASFENNQIETNPVLQNVKTEYFIEDYDIKHSPASVYFDDQINDFFDSSDCLYPESVVKVVSEEVESLTIPSIRKTRASTRLSTSKSSKSIKNISKDPLNATKRRNNTTGTRTLEKLREKSLLNVKKKVTCPMCTKKFQSVNFLNLHYKKIHLGLNSAYDRSRSRSLLKKKTAREKLEKNNASSLNARRQERKYPFSCPDDKCNQFFPSEYFRDAHHKRKHLGIEKPFQCWFCGKSFDRHQSLVVHSKSCTADGSYLKNIHKCPDCSQHFSTEALKDAHIKRLHDGMQKPIKSRVGSCDKIFASNLSMIDHLSRINRLNAELIPGKIDDDNLRQLEEYAEDETDKNSSKEDDEDWLLTADDDESDYEPFDSEDEDTKPKRKLKTTPQQIKIGRCGTPKIKGIRSPPLKKRRARRSSPGSKVKKPKSLKFQCTHEGCTQRFKLEAMRDGHVKQKHEGIERPFICDNEGCGKTFKKYFSVQIHKECHHGTNDDTFICETCGKTYYNRIAFQRHVFQVHVYKNRGKKNHACDECGKMFKGRTEVERHKAVHREQPEAKCDICEAVLKTNLHLYYHRRSIHQIVQPKENAPPLSICPQCGKTFTTKARLQKHVEIVHEQFYKFTCAICKMGHADKSSYERHMLKHTGEKPFTCDVCGKGLTRSSDLVRHMRLHTGEKPYKCDECFEAFTDGSKLRKHKKSVHAQPTQCCDVCGKKFVTYTQLRLHKRIHEPDHQGRKKRVAIVRNSDSTNNVVKQQIPKKRPRKPKQDKPEKKPTKRAPRKIIKKSEPIFDTSESSEEIRTVVLSPSPINLQLHPGHSQQQHHHQQLHSLYQLPTSSSVFNVNLQSQQQSSSNSSSELYRSNSVHSDTTHSQQQGYLLVSTTPHAQTQAFGLLAQSYNMDPNQYLNHLQTYLNPTSNNSNS